MDDGPILVEPVHWNARLIRSDDACYTEVDGVPCVVLADSGAVQALTPTWAAIWAQLDGRPVRVALGVDPDTMDATDARNLLEVLRRLKAKGIAQDSGDSSTPRLHPSLAATATVDRVELALRGHIEVERRSIDLTVDPGVDRRVVVTLVDRDDGLEVSIRRRFRRRPVDHLSVTDSTARTAPVAAAERFNALVTAMEDRTQLRTPGLVDLLAALAEHATPPGSPRR